MKDKVLETKQANVQEIKEKVEKAQAIVLMDYRGLTVDEVTDLRSKFRDVGVEYKVYKNTMMERAFKDCGFEEFTENFKGPNSIAFGYDDPVGVAKISKEFSKEHEKLEIKAGIVDGKIVSIEELEALASLPSREVLIAKFIGCLSSPMQSLANVMNGSMRSMVLALNAIAEKKGQEEGREA